MTTPLPLLLVLITLCGGLLAAPPEKQKQQPYTPAADLRCSWAFQADPALPNVLILGDPISIAYTLPVREKLVARLKATGARLVWASTTVVPDGEDGRFVGDDSKYNAIAARVMERHQIPINDLYAVSKAYPPAMFAKPGDVHFTAEGSAKLAAQVSEVISTNLKPPRGHEKNPG